MSGSLPGIGYSQIRPLVVKACPNEAESKVPVWLNPCRLQKLKGAAPPNNLSLTKQALLLYCALSSGQASTTLLSGWPGVKYRGDRHLQAKDM